MAITRTKTGTQNASVKAQLFLGATKVLYIAAGAPNKETLPRLIPVSPAAGFDDRVRVKTVGGLVSGFRGPFVINEDVL